nr:SNF2-related protein [Demequina sp. TTPB684]
MIIGDELGLGKTLTGLLTVIDDDARPALVVPLTHLPRRWVTELNESLPMLTVEVAKKTKPPQHIIDGHLPDVVVVPYSKLAGWAHALAGRVRTVLFDEVQDLRRGTVSDKGRAAAHVASEASFVVGLTATPVYNYGGEIHNLYDIIAPDVLGTREEFIREWGTQTYGGHVLVREPAALGEYLRREGLLLARTRKEVGRELPQVVKVPHTVESDPAALTAITGDAARLAEVILAQGTTRQERFQAAGELDWKVRQATGIAKAPYVAEFVKMLLESEEKVALFGWHRAVWGIWRRELDAFRPVMYTGSESPAQKAAAEDAFIHGDARVLMMSLRSGAGVDGLQKVCSVAVFGELDWSPQIHEQGIGRFRRDGMDENNPVVAYFLTSDEGSDPPIMETLQIKRNQAEPIISPDGKLLTNATVDTDRARSLARTVLANHRRAA